MTLNIIHCPKADASRIYIPRKEGGRGMTNLEMVCKTMAIGLNSYLQSSGDRMLPAVLQLEKKTKLHSIVKESRKFTFQFNMTQEEIDINTKPTKVAKDIKKKAKNASFTGHEKRMERETTTWKVSLKNWQR